MEFFDPMERNCPWCSRPPIHRPGSRPPMRPNPGHRPPVPSPCPCRPHMDGSCPCRHRPPVWGPQPTPLPWPRHRPWSMSGQEAEEQDYYVSEDYSGEDVMQVNAMPQQGVMPTQPMPQQGMMPTPPMPQQEMMPYNPEEGFSACYEDEMENDRDMQRLLNLYPEIARELMPFVEAECDKLEYEGSMMFDEYPDRTMLSRITAGIYDQVKDRYNPPEGEDQDETLAMNVETRRRYPARKNWLGDLIDVLFFHEMFHRRRRRRNYRRRY